MRLIKALVLAFVLRFFTAQGTETDSSSNSTATGTSSHESELPMVDLGYGLQQATSYNAAGDFYKFKNIRYAAAPLGNLRFRRPQRPLTNRTLDNGSQDRRCPQAIPSWAIGAQGWPTSTDLAERTLHPTSTRPALYLILPVVQRPRTACSWTLLCQRRSSTSVTRAKAKASRFCSEFMAVATL